MKETQLMGLLAVLDFEGNNGVAIQKADNLKTLLFVSDAQYNSFLLQRKAQKYLGRKTMNLSIGKYPI